MRDPSPGNAAARQRLRADLRMVAALGATLTYHQAARGIGLEPPHMIQSVTGLLEELMEEDARAGHPFIAAMVVSRARDGLPGLGFFATAAQLGRFDGDPWSDAAMAYHAAELALAHAFHAQGPDPAPRPDRGALP